MKREFILIAAMLALIFSACDNVGPDYVDPDGSTDSDSDSDTDTDTDSDTDTDTDTDSDSDGDTCSDPDCLGHCYQEEVGEFYCDQALDIFSCVLANGDCYCIKIVGSCDDDDDCTNDYCDDFFSDAECYHDYICDAGPDAS